MMVLYNKIFKLFDKFVIMISEILLVGFIYTVLLYRACATFDSLIVNNSFFLNKE